MAENLPEGSTMAEVLQGIRSIDKKLDDFVRREEVETIAKKAATEAAQSVSREEIKEHVHDCLAREGYVDLVAKVNESHGLMVSLKTLFDGQTTAKAERNKLLVRVVIGVVVLAAGYLGVDLTFLN